MIKGKTRSGFSFEIPKDDFDNMELVEALAEMAEGSPVAASRAVGLLLGDNRKKQLYEHLREKEGHVKATSVFAAVEDIFKAHGNQGKNS